MKKIVSLALSTAMAFSMFASVTSAATLTTQEKYNALVTQGIFAGYPNGEAYLDKDMTRAEFAKVVALLTGLDTAATTTSTYADQNYANAWYKPYVEAVTKAGYMQGTTTGAKKLFNPNGKVTVQEMAATLVRAAKLEIPTTGIDNGAAAWAKGEVQAAINAGLISKTSNFAGAATRGLLVDTAYAYQTALSKPAVASSEVTDNGATVIFTLANGEKVTVKPTTALQPNVATTVTFKYNNFDYSESVTWKVTSATKAVSAAATNLKEVDITFDGEVNVASAEDASKYVVSLGDVVDSAQVLEGGNVVRLTLKSGQTFKNQDDYTVKITGVTAGTTTLPAATLSFRPLDNVLPTVTAVKGLGTKAVKVTFSEPVQTVNSNNFQIDNAAFVGSVQLSEDGREAVLRPYTAFTTGDHNLTSSLVVDFNNLKSLSDTKPFTVAVDTEAPTVTEISATLERAVVTFSEDIDPNTVATSDFYWLNGSTKQYPTEVNRLAGNKYELIFSGSAILPVYTTNLYVDSVSDYTGNANTVKQFAVTATVNQTRPVVTDLVYNKTNGTVTVKFDRVVTFAPSNFTVTDSNGKVYSVLTAAGSNSKVATLTFVGTPGAGSYTIAIAGVKDTTVLTNAIEPVSKPFTIGDTGAPTVIGNAVKNVDNRTITLTFSEAMDPAKLQNVSNYLIEYGATQMRLPSNSQVRIANDYKSVVITLPATIDAVATNMAQVASITPLDLTDLAGNVLTGIGQKVNATVTVGSVSSAELTAPNKIEVTFNQAIESARVSDFTLAGYTIQNVTVSGSTVTLTTTTDIGTGLPAGGLNVVVAASNKIATVAGNGVSDGSTAAVTDAVAPTVKAGTTELSFINKTITLPFSENLNPANKALWAGDLIVTNLDGNAQVPVSSYTTDWDADSKSIVINLAGETVTPSSKYSVKVRAANTTIVDVAGKKAAESSTYVTATRNSVGTAQAAIGATTPSATTNQTNVVVAGTYTDATTVTVKVATAAAPTTTIATQTATLNNGNYSTTLTGLTGGATSTEYIITVTPSNAGGAGTPVTKNVTVDTVAPTVTTQLPAATTLLTADTSLVFSEDLNTASKDSVRNSVLSALTNEAGATHTVTWTNDRTLTIDVTLDAAQAPASGVRLGTVNNVLVTDLAGNTTTNVADLQA